MLPASTEVKLGGCIVSSFYQSARTEGQLWAVEQARSNEPGGTLGHWILIHLAGSEYQGWLGYE